MTTKIVEQEANAEELAGTKPLVTEAKPSTSEAGKADASKEITPKLGEGEKKAPELKYSEEDLQQRLQKDATTLAQSMKDKETTPLYAELKAATNKITQLETSVEDAKAESTLKRQEAAELEEWGDTPQVRSFHDERRKLTKLDTQVQKAIQIYEDNRTKFATDMQNSNAMDAAIKAVLPELGKLLDSFIQELKEGSDSPTAMKYLAQIKGGGYRQQLMDLLLKDASKDKTPEGGKGFEPDSSSHSAPGGIDLSTLSPGELVSRGIKKLKEKQGK